MFQKITLLHLEFLFGFLYAAIVLMFGIRNRALVVYLLFLLIEINKQRLKVTGIYATLVFFAHDLCAPLLFSIYQDYKNK